MSRYGDPVGGDISCDYCGYNHEPPHCPSPWSGAGTEPAAMEELARKSAEKIKAREAAAAAEAQRVREAEERRKRQYQFARLPPIPLGRSGIAKALAPRLCSCGAMLGGYTVAGKDVVLHPFPICEEFLSDRQRT